MILNDNLFSKEELKKMALKDCKDCNHFDNKKIWCDLIGISGCVKEKSWS